jgi:putative ABC transport system permease protein
MFQNDNREIVKRLTKRSLKSDKKRNLFIVMAITLTTLLIGSVFSIGMSLVESVKMNQIRFTGTVGHAAVGHPTASQIEKLHALNYVKLVGTNNKVGFVKNTAEMGKINLELHYFDKIEWENLRAPAYTDIEGNYPQKENEIMVTLAVLKRLGVDAPYIGMEIPLTYYTDSTNKDALISGSFRLSGWFRSYGIVQSKNTGDIILVSQELSQKYGKSIEKDGSATLMFDNESRVSEYCNALVSHLGLSENQPVITVEAYEINTGQSKTLLAIGSIVVFLIFTGYLLIYNVLYISVSRDVRFYGLLKTLGTTPKQIKRMVVGQILQLCLIGIPTGIILSLLLSLKFVPFFISELGAVSTEAIVSFSPFIYLGAVVFPLLTAILGASKPAKKAAGISPIEAQRYTGVEVKMKNTRSSAHGKPYKMAIRNIFRDRKRAGVVLLSLFLGVTTFLTVTTLVFSMNMAKYIESIYESDFVLESRAAWPTQKFDNVFMKKLESLPGFEWLSVTTWEGMRLDYSPDAFGKYIANCPLQEQIAKMTEKDIQENFRGFVLGVDGAMLKKRSKLNTPIDIDAFERGEIALIATDNPDLFKNVRELNISPSYKRENDHADHPKIKVSLGGFVPFGYKDIGSGIAPTIIISNALMREWFNEPIVSKINLDVSSDYEQNALIALKQIIGSDYEISLTSKMEAMEEMNGAKMALLVLGGGIALVIALIGILNFVNVMSVSIMVRKRELATLESIGMSRKQLKKLLIYEGLGYAVITLTFVLSIGNAATYGIFKLFKQQASFVTFTYPFIPVVIMIMVVLAVCFVTPQMLYRSINKSTIVERLREAV